MSNWFRRPLARGEILSIFFSLALFVTSEVRGPRTGLLVTAAVILVVGAVIAVGARVRSKSGIAEAPDQPIIDRLPLDAPADRAAQSRRQSREHVRVDANRKR